MSWCRWSTDINGQVNSDLYIYDSVNECITVHVAGRRRSNYADNPYREPQWTNQVAYTDDWVAEFIKASKLRSEWFDANELWEDLPEAYAGKNYDFGYEEIDSLIEFLKQAKLDGINFPEYVLDYALEYLKEH